MVERHSAAFSRLVGIIGTSWPGYEDYARWAHRRIPVVALEPRDAEVAA